MHGKAKPDGEPGGRELLDHLQVGLVRLARTAELFGVRQPEQPGPAEQLELRARETPVALSGGGGWPEFIVRDLGCQLEQRAGRVVAALALGGAHQIRTPTSSRVTLLSRSQPVSVQTTMSSIRAPSRPG